MSELLGTQVRSLGSIAAPAALELLDLTERIDDWNRRYPNGPLVMGRQPAPGDIVLSSNDYLSLANNPDIVDAQADALRSADNNVLMSSVFVQYLQAQNGFERTVADFLGGEAAILCQSGWAANDGVIQSIATSETPVYIDLFAHASLWQGISNAGATAHAFRHNRLDSLRSLLRRHGPGLIAVDAVYSTSGDICPLRELVALAEEHGCMLVVDESHSVGVWGPQGEGLVCELGLQDRVHLRTFSLSKAFVGRGGVAVGSARVIDYIRWHSRPGIFSSAVLPFEISGFEAALELIRHDDWRRVALRANTDYLRGSLLDLGFDVGASPAPIIALEGGPEDRTQALRDALEHQGVFGAVFCAPATPKNRALVRLTLNATLERRELDRVIEVCADLRAAV